jgi:hypothetical protein
MDDLETAIITRSGDRFDLTDRFGEFIASFNNWNDVADLFRSQDYSEEYIAKRAQQSSGPQFPSASSIERPLDK